MLSKWAFETCDNKTKTDQDALGGSLGCELRDSLEWVCAFYVGVKPTRAELFGFCLLCHLPVLCVLLDQHMSIPWVVYKRNLLFGVSLRTNEIMWCSVLCQL